jgi:hypothetical protein
MSIYGGLAIVILAAAFTAGKSVAGGWTGDSLLG